MMYKDSLLAAIRENRDKDEPRLAYSDYLDKNPGEDIDRAAFIRAQVRIKKVDPTADAELSALRSTVDALWEKNGSRWAVEDLGEGIRRRLCTVVREPSPDGPQKYVVYARGFPETYVDLTSEYATREEEYQTPAEHFLHAGAGRSIHKSTTLQHLRLNNPSINNPEWFMREAHAGQILNESLGRAWDSIYMPIDSSQFPLETPYHLGHIRTHALELRVLDSGQHLLPYLLSCSSDNLRTLTVDLPNGYQDDACRFRFGHYRGMRRYIPRDTPRAHVNLHSIALRTRWMNRDQIAFMVALKAKGILPKLSSISVTTRRNFQQECVRDTCPSKEDLNHWRDNDGVMVEADLRVELEGA